ncbi:hypothetical protein MY10362_008569 [Beauveria mimosiformis]
MACWKTTWRSGCSWARSSAAEEAALPTLSAALDLAETATQLTDPDDLYEPGTEAPRAYQRAYQQTNYGAEEAGSEGGSEGDEDAD